MRKAWQRSPTSGSYSRSHARAHRQRVAEAGDDQPLRHPCRRGLRHAAAYQLVVHVHIQPRRPGLEVDRQQLPKPGHPARPARIQRQIGGGAVLGLSIDAHGLFQPAAMLLEKGHRRRGADALRPDQAGESGLDRDLQALPLRRPLDHQRPARHHARQLAQRARGAFASDQEFGSHPLSRRRSGFHRGVCTADAVPASSARTRHPAACPDRRRPAHPADRR